MVRDPDRDGDRHRALAAGDASATRRTRASSSVSPRSGRRRRAASAPRRMTAWAAHPLRGRGRPRARGARQPLHQGRRAGGFEQ